MLSKLQRVAPKAEETGARTRPPMPLPKSSDLTTATDPALMTEGKFENVELGDTYETPSQ